MASTELLFYLWPSSYVNDHVALEIRDLNVYISWSPRYGKKIGGSKTNMNNLFDCESKPKTRDEDYAENCNDKCAVECKSHRAPKQIIRLEISYDKAAKIKAWWDDYRGRRENYKLHLNNCCHIVLRALSAAFGDFRRIGMDSLFLHPGRIANFMKLLRDTKKRLQDGEIKKVYDEFIAQCYATSLEM